ncbi:MAG: selenide, water dikinase SelD [Anaerolineaceae bacterium]|nr:selenide, water dikinase SelD [Anaerolineaceae bacterium]
MAQVLRPLNGIFDSRDYPDLLVGLDQPDDAAIWKLSDDRALVVTTDFFTPVVDDAYDYGSIAAANSLSDVYAMGGQPFLALNIAALPPQLPTEVMANILRGGAEKTREAGVVVAGGHTIQDKEPKFGLVVIGFVDPRRAMTKSGARPGDRLVITKPLGGGVTTTALKQQLTTPDELNEVVGWMKRLNRDAGLLASRFELRGATDITGYSLLGHAFELASASGVGLEFCFDQIPLLSGALKYAREWTFPGGASDNALFFEQYITFDPAIEDYERMLLFDPQTSGGLLLSVPEEKLPAFLAAADEISQPAWEVGRVVNGQDIRVVRTCGTA